MVKAVKKRSRYLVFTLLAQPTGIIGLLIILATIILAIFAGQIAPYDPYDVSQRNIHALLTGSQTEHPLGTDAFGADILSMLIYGTRVTLIVGLSTAVLVPLLGALIGACAAFFGGGLDRSIMLLIDIVMVLPGLPLMILVVSYIGGSYWIVVIMFTFLGWAGVSRMVRGRIFSEKESLYVEAARNFGATNWHIIKKHLIPSTYPLLVLTAARVAAGSILAEAGLSFLGFGDPKAISWGKMLAEAQTQGALIFGAWWWVLFPGLAVFLISFSFICVGYCLEIIFNPRLKTNR